MSERWIYVALPGACFALCVREGFVVDGPPIARAGRLAVVGMPERQAAAVLRQRGARFRDF